LLRLLTSPLFNEPIGSTLEFKMKPIFKLALPRTIAYSHIDMTIGRHATPGARLAVEIECFGPTETAPARIVFGPLHKLRESLQRDHNINRATLVALLLKAGCPLAVVNEVSNDLQDVPSPSQFQLVA
jgi:hypothetical protein